MTQQRQMWSPYRIGVVIALLGFGSGLFIFVGFLMLVAGEVHFPIWLFIPAMVVGGLTGVWMNPRHGERGGPACCPHCGKSVFQLWGGESFRASMELIWPERICSDCGADLTGGRDWRY